MRRPRVLRATTATATATAASSLCVFCACRLGAIDWAAAASSTTTRGPFPFTRAATTTARAPFHSAATPAEAGDHASDASLPPWYDPTSSLSMAEQKEKADRIAMRQQHEAAQNHAVQEPLWKDGEEARLPLRQQARGGRRKPDDAAKPAGRAYRKVLLNAPAGSGQGGSIVGSSLGQAMLQHRQPRRGADAARESGSSSNHGADAASKTRSPQSEASKASPVHFRRITLQQPSNDDTATAQPVSQIRARGATGGEPGSKSVGKAAHTKVSNPFGPPTSATVDKQESTPATSGWGKGATQLAPLEYAEVARQAASKTGETQVKENIPDEGPGIRLHRDGSQKSFTPQYDGGKTVEDDPVDQQQHDKPLQADPTPVDRQQEDLQAQQSVYEQAAKMFKSRSSQAVDNDPVPSGTSGRGSQEAVTIAASKHSEEEVAQQSRASHAATEAYDHHNFLEQAGYIDAADSAWNSAPEISTSKGAMPSDREAAQTAANAGSFGYFSEEPETEAAPQSHIKGVAEVSTPEKDDAPSQAQPQRAEASPLARMAHQTQRAQETSTRQNTAAEAGKQPKSSATPGATPPPPPSIPPPTVPPPAAPAAPTGGQLAWQPIEGHAQGGQWIWQSSPPAPPASPVEAPRRSTRADDSSTGSTSLPHVRIPEPASVSLGDSGYRATPFKADEYQTGSSFDEEKAAGWQHLRRQSRESAAPAPLTAPSPAPQTSKPQVDFDDETWVDRTFDNHVREREERLKAQKEREQQRQAQMPVRDAPRWPHNESGQADRQRKCARCGEAGHIARFCPKASSPFTQPNSGGRFSDLGNERPRDRGDSSRIPMPFERRDDDRSPFRFEPARPPFSSRETAGEQRPHKAWGSDQVIPTEPVDMPTREPRFGSIRRFVPTQDQMPDEMSRDGPHKFTPVGGSRHNTQGASVDRETESTPARRSDRFEVEAEVDEQARVPEARISREKAARKSRWIDAEEDVEQAAPAASRKGQRAGRREYDEDEDDNAEARDTFRARKAARQAEKEAKENKRLKEARQERKVKKAEDTTPISIPDFVSVQQLSQLLGVRYEQFIGRLEELGYDDVFPGMTLNAETSGMIAMEYNFDPNVDSGAREEEERDIKPRPEVEDKEFLPVRPPVVTIMGHVDHGKTTILDYLRKSSVAAGEAGGITQHIGAFSVPMASSGRTITFLDTPGHAAFLAMRQRGANVTDIVILVVAADDSVKPQTLEAIKHAKAAGVPMIVAINKVDKPEADIERVKQDLARHGVEIEDFGGETQVVPVSGKTGTGMDELEETVVALSEILDHRAETDGGVEGWVLEATTKERGRVATVLVRRGTLRPSSVLVAGKTWARVRTLRNEGGRILQEVGPGMPVEVDGWRDQPVAGDEVLQAPNEQKATSVVEFRQERDEREKAAADMEAINEARRTAAERQQKEREAAKALKQAQRTASAEGGTADVVTTSKPDDLDAPQQEQTGQIDVPFVIKADVSGSVEAVSAYIMSVSNPLIAPSILHSQVGPVHESDIELANAAGGHIIAFNLPPNPQMQGMAESQGVKILENNIIYRVLDDVKSVLEEKLPPMISQRVLGEAEVAAAFEISVGGRKKLKIAGCKVRNGMIGKGARVRIMRGSEKVYDGIITSLKNVKKDVTEMRKGTECGMGFENWEGFEVGDQVQTYEEISEQRKL